MKEKKHQTTPRFKCIGMLLTLALILIGRSPCSIKASNRRREGCHRRDCHRRQRT